MRCSIIDEPVPEAREKLVLAARVAFLSTVSAPPPGRKATSMVAARDAGVCKPSEGTLTEIPALYPDVPAVIGMRVAARSRSSRYASSAG